MVQAFHFDKAILSRTAETRETVTNLQATIAAALGIGFALALLWIWADKKSGKSTRIINTGLTVFAAWGVTALLDWVLSNPSFFKGLFAFLGR